MANNMTDFLEKELLDHTLGVASWTMPTVYLALFTADPGETGTLTNEVTNANAYARVEITTEMGTSSGGGINNTAEIAFTQASGSWGTVTYIGIMDSGTHGAGNMIFWGLLTVSKAVDSGDTFKIAATDLSATLT